MLDATVIVLFVLALVAGSFTRGRRSLGHWGMFTESCVIFVDLYHDDDARRPFKLFAHRPSHAPAMTAGEFQLMLSWLRERGIVVSGRGILLSAEVNYRFEVRASEVESKHATSVVVRSDHGPVDPRRTRHWASLRAAAARRVHPCRREEARADPTRRRLAHPGR